jgi:hypothetical protein
MNRVAKVPAQSGFEANTNECLDGADRKFTVGHEVCFKE